MDVVSGGDTVAIAMRGQGQHHLGVKGTFVLAEVSQVPASGNAAPAQGECTLIPGVFGVFIQVLLFAVCCSVLIFKKQLEVKRGDTRTWSEFLLDSSKQLVGAGTIHLLNLVFASVLGGLGGSDACSWYFINIAIDCTLGVGIEYAILRMLTSYVLPSLLSPEEVSQFETGNYGHGQKPDLIRYLKQLGLWVLVVILMKLVMVGVMVLFSPVLASAADILLSPLKNSQQAKLFMVMILTPLFFNALQFWLVDGFLKKKEVSSAGEAEALRSRTGSQARDIEERYKD